MGTVNHMAHTVSTQAVSVRDPQVAKPVLLELRLLSWGLFIFLFSFSVSPLPRFIWWVLFHILR